MAEKNVKVTFRAPSTLKILVEEYVTTKGIHMNPSDFYRDAAREKIQRDAPELYRQPSKIEEGESDGS